MSAKSAAETILSPAPVRTGLLSLAAPDVYRLTVDEYERLAEAGVLDYDRVELIDGYLVRKMPKKPPHIWAVASILKATLSPRHPWTASTLR